MSNDRWLVSYADFITLLFGFFVVLYAFSKADEKKRVEVTAAVDTAFHALGIFPGAAARPSPGASGKNRINRESSTAAWRCLTCSL